MNATTKQRMSASERQKKFVEKKRASGYAPLTAVFVPNAIKDQCRQLVADFVKDWEGKQANQF